MRTKLMAAIAATTFAMICAGSAHAAILDFNVITTGNNVSFQLDSNPTPNGSFVQGFFFDFVATSVNGAAPQSNTIDFFTSTVGGGLNIGGFSGFQGDQVFSGEVTTPIFAPGVFNLNELGGGAATLTITAAATTPAVPEPASWMMMITGFCVVGATMRRRSTKISFA